MINLNLRFFSSFDICLLPDTISEKRNGPAFRNGKDLGGIFDGSAKLSAQLSITKKCNVYLQFLLDCKWKDQAGFQINYQILYYIGSII